MSAPDVLNSPESDKIALPDIPAMAVNTRHACILSTDGELKTVSHEQAQLLTHEKPVLVCHAPYTRGRLGAKEFYAFDILELFAFVHPTRFCVPTPHGLCEALGIIAPAEFEDIPLTLFEITRALLKDIRNDSYRKLADPLEISASMGMQGKGWVWTPFIFKALGEIYDTEIPVHSKAAMNVWRHMSEWSENAPEPPPSHFGVSGEEAQERLEKLLGHESEKRPEQIQYAREVTAAFAPVQDADHPHAVLAEAGTGIGKTLGYLAPASVWAEKNDGTVWISTYTKNLQRQIDQELDRLYPNPDLKDTHVAVRKGRENYLCLLNLEETAAGASLAKLPGQAIGAGIIARWAAAAKDGDLSGKDFPGWLSGILGYAQTLGMADRRGECIYSACDHYHKCFVEKSVRKAKRARIVIANHALVMINAALSSPGEDMPGRYIFDEGHHLFDAADNAYAAHLSALETRDLRRWIRGGEGRRNSRARGLKRRAEDLISGDPEAAQFLENIMDAAQCLTSDGWQKRLKDTNPAGATENFLALIYAQVHARADGRYNAYSMETQTYPLNDGILEKAGILKKDLKMLQKPLISLAQFFRKKLSEDSGMMDADTRRRLDALSTALERRGAMMLQAWIDILETLKNGKTPPEFVDWMEVTRAEGRVIDTGLYRHHTDPMKPFAASMKPHLQGMAVTSATLRDETDNWETAQTRTGVNYLTGTPHLAGFDSPFDYASQTKIFIINDVRKDDLNQVAGAYRALFTASGGGALGLFTAIQRLRAVHEKIALPLEEAGLSLYSQHVDDIDPGTLVDIFRDDTHACLLGTDAVRDGVDVPGQSLRLIAFDRVPWPRPTILHKARRKAFGGRAYDEMITRLKLKQAFGRLIRRKDDKGVFVMLDSGLPSRLHTAFPEQAPIEKAGLADVIQAVKDFLA